MNLPAKRILIYRLGSLGDTVIALPCFHKVREAYPEADITLLTNRPVMAKAAPLEAILGSTYFFNRIVDYPVGTRDFSLLKNLFSDLRALKIDTVVNLAAARSRMSAIRDKLFFRAIGGRQFIGFPSQKEDFEVSIDPATGDYEWEAKRLSRRIRQLGSIELEAAANWDLVLSDAELYDAEQALNGISPGFPIITACVGTKMQSKDWGGNNWMNLFHQLAKTLDGWKLVLVGAPDEAELAQACLESWGGNGINLCGKTSPRVSAAILKQANIFVGHDSGPMHLAACVGTPCVAIFSARNLPRQWYPRGQKNRIIYHRPECAGCNLEVCIEQQKKCILSITVSEVKEAVLQTLEMNVKAWP